MICKFTRLGWRDFRVRPTLTKPYFVFAVFLPGLATAQTTNPVGQDEPVLLAIACVLLAMLAGYFFVLLKRERKARRAESARLAQLEREGQQAILANQQKSRFLERMSNAFRTPLNVILGFAQLQQSRLEPNAPVEQRRATEATLTAGWQLLELLDDIVDIARLERGTLRLREEDCALDDVIAHAIGLVQDAAHTAQINIEFVPGELGVRADYNRLKQVLVNLLKNAVQYNRPGGWVRISTESAGGGMVTCQVSDSGVGVPPDYREQVFNSFDRSPAGEQAQPEGAGLGLSMARFLCEAMGGSLTLEDSGSEGAQFRITLKAATAKTADIAPQFEKAVPASPSRPLTAVYVEDHRASLELMQAIMAPLENVRLLTASNAEDGIQLVREYHPDLVLLDINLAGMDGIAAARTIRADPELHEIPLVALSADAEEHQISAAMEAGFTEYLTKPLNIEQLWRLLESLPPAEQPPSEC